jgi:hypothetical protein
VAIGTFTYDFNTECRMAVNKSPNHVLLQVLDLGVRIDDLKEAGRRSGRYRYGSSKSLREAGLKKLSELRCCPELRDRIQFLERRRERVGETPDRVWSKILILRFEVQVVNRASEVFGSFQFALDERLINNYFRGDIGEFASLPCLDLLSHRLEVALHPINSDRYAIDQRERLRVFGEYRSEHATNGQGDETTDPGVPELEQRVRQPEVGLRRVAPSDAALANCSRSPLLRHK